MTKMGIEAFREQFADSPSVLAWLEANFAQGANQELILPLLGDVDESAYSLREWIDAFLVMAEWLDKNGLTASLEDQIGFLCCASGAAGSSANLTALPELVIDLLDSYGFERAVRK